MASDKYTITNADDITLTFAGETAGGVDKLYVSSFEVSESHDDTTKHGVGRNAPVGRTFGNSTYSFDMTLEGENVSAWNSATGPSDNRPEFSISVSGPEGQEVSVPVCWPDEGSVSGDDGDAMETSISGDCMEPEGR